ncbi:MAG: orotate phosphoribosyltransferase [Proteobacteria bacterium]|nr:orotate phosphoribosyltransferase [Pseudomonadota bacterium]
MTQDDRTAEQKAAGAETARALINIGAVNFRPQEPYTLTAGWASPVYIDCRKVISYLPERRRIMELGTELIRRDIGTDIDAVAGGETAGIPYAAWLSESLNKPMLYVRKKPKGFGRMAQIEGTLQEGSKVLLVEDLATDGGSKITFIDALRGAGAECSDVFVVFFYGAFPGADETMAKAKAKLHYLATWQDVLEEAQKDGPFSQAEIDGVRDFLADPLGWSEAQGGRAA